MQTDIKLHSDFIPGEEKSMGRKLQKGMENLVNPPIDKSLLVVSNVHKEDPNLRMNAIEWYGTEDMRSIERLAPDITDPQDAIVKITTSTVCGSDLHMYYNQVPGAGILLKHDILGHEAVGIVTKVGPSCKNLSVGDRVVISAVISCGECKWCKQGKVSLCDKTNPSSQLEKLYGQRLAGIFGYTHLTGGFAGLQAEYARVPLADNNTLKITNKQLKDKQLIVLSDILCTGFHGLELGSVKEGDNIAIWGAGPVGLMATLCAIKLKKVNRVIVIDNLQWRLDQAAKLGAETLNFNEIKDVPEELRKRIPDGPDVCIECAGFRYTKSLTHKLQSTLKLETDTVDIVNEMILSCQKGGRLSLIGDYFGYTNNFPIGAMMEKNLTVQGGQVFVQKYWNYLLKQIETGILDPTFVFTHNFKLEDAPKAYKAFGEHDKGFIKPLLLTKFHNLSA